jgi:hypothetical protein
MKISCISGFINYGIWTLAWFQSTSMIFERHLTGRGGFGYPSVGTRKLAEGDEALRKGAIPVFLRGSSVSPPESNIISQ